MLGDNDTAIRNIFAIPCAFDEADADADAHIMAIDPEGISPVNVFYAQAHLCRVEDQVFYGRDGSSHPTG